MHKHARISDLPGYPCPPRVRDIATNPGSWGWIGVGEFVMNIAADELGYLWVKADAVPQARIPDENDANPGAVVFEIDGGIGIFIHPRSYRYMATTSRLDHQPDEWLPVNMVAVTLPIQVEIQGAP